MQYQERCSNKSNLGDEKFGLDAKAACYIHLRYHIGN